MNYQQAWNELMSYVPKLSPPIAQKLVQRAWSEIRDSRLWSFLVAETVIAVPEQIATGTVTVTNGSAIVAGDATADAAWLAINNAEFVVRQFRSGAGPIYNIVAYTSPNITLDRVYAEQTATGASYSVYKCYYPAPANFLRWTTVIDATNGYQLGIDRTKQQIDHMDPLRGAMGEPIIIASYKYDLINAPLTTSTGHLFELYPHPITQRSYPALYQTNGTAFTAPSDTTPAVISDEVLMAKAKHMAYEWAMANGSAHDQLRGVNWLALRASVEEDYKSELFRCQKQDEETFSQNWIESYIFNRWTRVAYDGNYAMNHAPLVGYWR